MSTVTIPRELAQSLLVLMTRDATDGNVPAGQWLTFANALDKAMHAPRTSTIAPGSTLEPGTYLPASLVLVDPEAAPCRFCQTAVTADGGLCASCTDDLLRDAQELEARPCPRCAHE